MNVEFIELNHLRTHEVNYELKIRGLFSAKSAIDVKRKCLRKALRSEVASPDVLIRLSEFNFEVEKTELTEKKRLMHLKNKRCRLKRII